MYEHIGKQLRTTARSLFWDEEYNKDKKNLEDIDYGEDDTDEEFDYWDADA